MNNTPQVKAPWLKSKDPEVPAALTYSELSMCSRVEEMVRPRSRVSRLVTLPSAS